MADSVSTYQMRTLFPSVLTNLALVVRSSSKGVVITQLSLESVEALGLETVNLLGICRLTVQERQSKRFANRLNVLESTPSDDPATSKRIESHRKLSANSSIYKQKCQGGAATHGCDHESRRGFHAGGTKSGIIFVSIRSSKTNTRTLTTEFRKFYPPDLHW
jgi:hypothetical protein